MKGFMKRAFLEVPLVSILLVLLACIHFEQNTPNTSTKISGLAGGIGWLALVAIVLVFRIFNAVHEACYRRGLIPQRLHFRYDVLIPVAIVAVAFQFRWQGQPIVNIEGKTVPEWYFQWSDPDYNVAFIGAVIGVVFLLRIFTLARAIADAPLRQR
jgi:hypothetical protein